MDIKGKLGKNKKQNRSRNPSRVRLSRLEELSKHGRRHRDQKYEGCGEGGLAGKLDDRVLRRIQDRNFAEIG